LETNAEELREEERFIGKKA